MVEADKPSIEELKSILRENDYCMDHKYIFGKKLWTLGYMKNDGTVKISYSSGLYQLEQQLDLRDFLIQNNICRREFHLDYLREELANDQNRLAKILARMGPAPDSE